MRLLIVLLVFRAWSGYIGVIVGLGLFVIKFFDLLFESSEYWCKVLGFSVEGFEMVIGGREGFRVLCF